MLYGSQKMEFLSGKVKKRHENGKI